MKYTTEQAKDILKLANNYGEVNSTEKEQAGCYIIDESESHRKVLSKGCNYGEVSAEIDAIDKVNPLKSHKLKGASVFTTGRLSLDVVNRLLSFGISLIVYGSKDKMAETVAEAEIVHMPDWRYEE